MAAKTAIQERELGTTLRKRVMTRRLFLQHKSARRSQTKRPLST